MIRLNVVVPEAESVTVAMTVPARINSYFRLYAVVDDMPEIVSVILVGVPDVPDSVATQTTCLSEDRRNAAYAAGSYKPDTPVRFYLHTGCPSRVLQIHITARRPHTHRRT